MATTVGIIVDLATAVAIANGVGVAVADGIAVAVAGKVAKPATVSEDGDARVGLHATNPMSNKEKLLFRTTVNPANSD